MYVMPIVLIFLLAIAAAAWSPLFAIVAAGLLFVAFLAYVGLRSRTEKENDAAG